MKKLVVLVAVSIAILASVSAQPSKDEILDLELKSSLNFNRKMEYRQYVGGYKPDTNFVFQNTLLKLFRGTLNFDSLIASQPQLSLITVNEFITDPVYTQSGADFFRKPKFAKYNTSDYVFSHWVSDNAVGRREESIIIYEAATRRKLRGVTIQYEAYSNQVRTVIDNCYEHLK
jgi:hypothetical protein